MAFMGTIVVNGRGRGIVVETGRENGLGQDRPRCRRIVRHGDTPSTEDCQICPVHRAPCARKHGGNHCARAHPRYVAIADLFTTAVAASVAAVPEGLPIVVTITMAIGISRMARRMRHTETSTQ